MKSSAANRRRSTWPPRELYNHQTPPHPGCIVQHVRDNMDRIEANVRQTCEAGSTACDRLRCDLQRLTQAANSVRQGKETV